MEPPWLVIAKRSLNGLVTARCSGNGASLTCHGKLGYRLNSSLDRTGVSEPSFPASLPGQVVPHPMMSHVQMALGRDAVPPLGRIIDAPDCAKQFRVPVPGVSKTASSLSKALFSVYQEVSNSVVCGARVTNSRAGRARWLYAAER